MKQEIKKKTEFRNINIFTDVTTYRLPIAGIMSITHRISIAILFFSLPFVFWLFERSVRNEQTFKVMTNLINEGCPFAPAWLIKLTVLTIFWAFFHHLIASLRHILFDLNHDLLTKKSAQQSAIAVFVVALSFAFIFALKLFDVF